MNGFYNQLKELNESFEKGFLPDELNFSTSKTTLLDDIIEDVKHLAFYKEYKIRSKFPYSNSIQGFDKVIDKMVEDVSNKTLTELLENKTSTENKNYEK